MKRSLFFFLMMTALSFAVVSGCESMDMVRANPISMKINGTSFVSNPDTLHTFIVQSEPEQEFFQYDDAFSFELFESLYSLDRKVLKIHFVFEGSGEVQLGERYPLVVPMDGQISTHRPFIIYNGVEYEASAGWIEFSEFGTDDAGGRAYMSGKFGITMKDSSLEIKEGGFGRMLECKYYDYKTSQQ